MTDAMEIYQREIHRAERWATYNEYLAKGMNEFVKTPGVKMRQRSYRLAAEAWRKKSVWYAKCWAVAAAEKKEQGDDRRNMGTR